VNLQCILFLDGYTTEDMKLSWKGDDPVQWFDGEIPGYEFLDAAVDYCTSATATGTNSC